MNVQIRSMRDPGFWLPIAIVAAIVVPLGVVATWWAEGYTEHLKTLAEADVEVAADAAARTLRTLGWVVCGVTVAMGGFLIRYFQLGISEQRLPPSGWWSLGATHAIAGPRARWIARLGLCLASIVFVCGFGFLLAMQRLIGHFAATGI